MGTSGSWPVLNISRIIRMYYLLKRFKISIMPECFYKSLIGTQVNITQSRNFKFAQFLFIHIQSYPALIRNSPNHNPPKRPQRIPFGLIVEGI